MGVAISSPSTSTPPSAVNFCPRGGCGGTDLKRGYRGVPLSQIPGETVHSSQTGFRQGVSDPRLVAPEHFLQVRQFQDDNCRAGEDPSYTGGLHLLCTSIRHILARPNRPVFSSILRIFSGKTFFPFQGYAFRSEHSTSSLRQSDGCGGETPLPSWFASGSLSGRLACLVQFDRGLPHRNLSDDRLSLGPRVQGEPTQIMPQSSEGIRLARGQREPGSPGSVNPTSEKEGGSSEGSRLPEEENFLQKKARISSWISSIPSNSGSDSEVPSQGLSTCLEEEYLSLSERQEALMPSSLQDYSEVMDISQGIQEDCASNSSSSIPDHPHRRISGRVGRALPPSISERSVVLAIPEVPHKLSGIVCGLSHSIPHQTSPGQPHPSYDRQLYSCGMPSEARFEVPNPQSGSLADLTTLSGKCVAHLSLASPSSLSFLLPP